MPIICNWQKTLLKVYLSRDVYKGKTSSGRKKKKWFQATLEGEFSYRSMNQPCLLTSISIPNEGKPTEGRSDTIRW